MKFAMLGLFALGMLALVAATDGAGVGPSVNRCLGEYADSGLCRADFTRYSYDPNARACRAFSYGGCGGSENNFNSLAECVAVCESK